MLKCNAPNNDILRIPQQIFINYRTKYHTSFPFVVTFNAVEHTKLKPNQISFHCHILTALNVMFPSTTCHVTHKPQKLSVLKTFA